MPDFDGWSYVGGNTDGGVTGYNSFREQVADLEAELEEAGGWEAKKPKVLWRGSVGLGNSDVPQTRPELVKAAEGKEWSDVQAGHFVRQVDHCKWQYLVHTEGE